MSVKICTYCELPYQIVYELDVSNRDMFLLDINNQANACYKCFNCVDEESGEYGCRECGIILSEKSALVKHFSQLHNNDKRNDMTEFKRVDMMEFKKSNAREVKKDNTTLANIPNRNIISQNITNKNIVNQNIVNQNDKSKSTSNNKIEKIKEKLNLSKIVPPIELPKNNMAISYIKSPNKEQHKIRVNKYINSPTMNNHKYNSKIPTKKNNSLMSLLSPRYHYQISP